MARDTSFYYSFLVLPREKRAAILAVWDFCRAVDDAVDEARDDATAAAALAGWRQDLERCFNGADPQSAQARRLQPFLARFMLPRRAFEDVIDGVEMDLAVRRYQTFDDLREYCLRVASAVGLICVEIFGYRNPATRDYARELGLALQLTNIIRDLRADLARDRLYLPLDDLAACGVSEQDLRAGAVTPAVSALLRRECDRAREFYASAERLMPREDRRRLTAARIMGGIYFAILERIERAGYNVFDRVVRTPRPVRALIAARIWTQSLLGL
jgi:phytoene synthase